MLDEKSSFDRMVTTLRSAGCVYAEDEARLLFEAFTADALTSAVARRVAGTPLEQVLGWAEFCGLRIIVESGVFVPRRRTELLVELAALTRPRVVLDMCCGSGAVGTALANELGGTRVHATDIDARAVHCARRNLEPLGGAVHEGDLFVAVPQELRGAFDAVVVNAPYVPSDEISAMPSEARDHEPRVALDGGPDGLDVQRRIAAEVRDWLTPTGHIFVETSGRQAEESVRILTDVGFSAVVHRSSDKDGTVVSAAVAGET